MNVLDYSQMSDDALIQTFVANSQRIGSAWNLPVKIHPRSPESQAIVREIQAISAELEARNSAASVRRLFEHESRDVRGWASGQFAEFDPEWALATMSGLVANLPTREVLALAARARQGPPAHPTLEVMSTDQLVARFEDAAIREYATQFIISGDGTEPWNIETRNGIVVELHQIMTELKSRNALERLLPLLDHQNSIVRIDAAFACRTLAPDRAMPVLEGAAANRSEDIFGLAWDVLHFPHLGAPK